MALGGPFVLVGWCAPLARVFFDFGCFGAWGRAASPQIVPTSPKCWAKLPTCVWKEFPPSAPMDCRGAAWMGPNAVPPGRLARASRPTGAPRVCGGDVPRAPELWAGGARVVLSSHPPWPLLMEPTTMGPPCGGASNSHTPTLARPLLDGPCTSHQANSRTKHTHLSSPQFDAAMRLQCMSSLSNLMTKHSHGPLHLVLQVWREVRWHRFEICQSRCVHSASLCVPHA